VHTTMAVTPLCSCEVWPPDTMCASIAQECLAASPRTALKTAPRQSRRPGFRAAIDPCIRQMPTGLNTSIEAAVDPDMQRPIVAANTDSILGRPSQFDGRTLRGCRCPRPLSLLG